MWSTDSVELEVSWWLRVMGVDEAEAPGRSGGEELFETY